MGNTAEKLTYLSGTKQLLKDTINLTGANITNDTFRSYVSKLKQGYLDILNNGIDTLYNNFPKVYGIGSNLSLTPTYRAPIKLNEIQGNTLQNGTPTPSSPVPIQSVTGLQNVTISNADNTDSNTYEVNLGKNLLDYSTLVYGYVNWDGTFSPQHTNGEMRSNFIKVQPSTTYTFKIFETSSTYDNWFGVGEYSSNNQSSFVQRDTMTTTSQNYITFTTSSTTQYVIVSARNLENATKVQLEKGSSSTSYSPYFTPIELNKIGDYKDRIYKDNGKWYIEKQIGKVNLEDYEYNKYGASTGYSRNTTTQIPNIKYVSVNTELGKGLCEKYQIHTGSGMSGSNAENHFAIDVSMFQVTIPNNDTPSGLFYYALATPTYTEITNTELIEDLESLYNAKSEDGTTNIEVTSEDLPMIMSVNVIKGDA